jgi:Domain of unknown function (DUF5658)
MNLERRNRPDQRHAPTRPLNRHSLRGRRKKARRQEEDSNYYVDRYEPRYLIIISLILVLCVLDAYFTFKIIGLGGKELNQFMLVFINTQPVAALVFKYLVTAVCIVFILIHKNFWVFGRLRVSSLIHVFFCVYLALVAYEAVVFLNHTRAPSL